MKSSNVLVAVAIVVALSIHVGLALTTDVSTGVRNYSAIIGALAVSYVASKIWERRTRGRIAPEGLDDGA